MITPDSDRLLMRESFLPARRRKTPGCQNQSLLLKQSKIALPVSYKCSTASQSTAPVDFMTRECKGERRQASRSGFSDLPVISSCIIQLSGNCGLDRSFYHSPKVNPCAMCAKATADCPDVGSVYTFLERVFKMRCMSLVFHEGDLLTREDALFAMVE